MTKEYLSQFPPLSQLHIDNDFIFMLTMQDKFICKRFAEILLNMKIKDIVYPKVQKSEKPFYLSKSVRFDAYIAQDNKVINVEMQSSHYENLMLRARYYQSMIDATILKAGADYEDLKETYLLFVCKNDPFHKDIPVYTIKPYCEELLSFDISDKTEKRFFACNVYNNVQDIELKALMQYIYTYKATNDFTNHVDNFIESQKKKEEIIMNYGDFNLLEMDARRLGKQEGIREGKQEGRQEEACSIVKSMLKNNLDFDMITKCTGLSYEQIRSLQ